MNLNEFVAKKLGELLAFTRVSAETITKGRNALVEVFGEDKVLDMEEKNKLHGEAIVALAKNSSVLETTEVKAEKTEVKLKSMRDLYVADQWDNATELMEWSGFFEGAAVVHWALVRGCAEGLNDEPFLTLAEEGVVWHYELLELAENHLGTIGQDKATI